MSMAKDYERHNEATRLGWSTYYFMGKHIKEEAINTTIQYLLSVLNHTSPTPPQETAAQLLRRLHKGQR